MILETKKILEKRRRGPAPRPSVCMASLFVAALCLFTVEPIFAGKIAVMAEGESLEGFHYAIKRLDLSPRIMRQVEGSVPGDGTLAGRQQVIYTQTLPSGPQIAAGMASGRLELPEFSEGFYSVEIAKPGYETRQVRFKAGDPVDTAVSLAPRRGVLSGRITDQDGNPVPGARFILQGVHHRYDLNANEQGEFSYWVFEDQYNLLVLPSEHYGKYVEKRLRIEHKGQTTKLIRITKLKSGVALVKLFDRKGNPLSGHSVGFGYDSPDIKPRKKIRGLFLGFLEGKHAAEESALIQSFLSHELKRTPAEYANGAFAPPGDTRIAQAAMPLAGAAVAAGSPDLNFGRMLNELQPESIFRDSPEDIFGAEPKDYFQGTTDGSGNLEATGLKPGRYKIKISKDGYEVSEEGISVEITSGVIAEKQIILGGTTIPVSFTLVDEDGAPIPDAVCYIDDLPTVPSRTSDEMGSVLFGHVNKGDHFLKCSGKNYESLASQFRVSWGEIRSAQDAEGTSVIVEKKLGKLTLRSIRLSAQFLALSQSGHGKEKLVLPIPDAVVSVTPATNSDLVVAASPDLPGFYEVKNLRIDKAYTLEMTPGDPSLGRQMVNLNPAAMEKTPLGDGLEFMIARGIDLAEVADASAAANEKAGKFYGAVAQKKFTVSDFVLMTAGAVALSGSLVDVNGQGVPGAEVTVAAPNKTWREKTDSKGKVEFQRITVLAGEDISLWKISAEKPGYLKLAGTIAKSSGATSAGYAIHWGPFKKPDFSEADKEDLATFFGAPFNLTRLGYDIATKRFAMEGRFNFPMKNLPEFAKADSFRADMRINLEFKNTPAAPSDTERAVQDLAYYFRTEIPAQSPAGVMSRASIAAILSKAMPQGEFSERSMRQNLEQLLAILLNKRIIDIARPETVIEGSGGEVVDSVKKIPEAMLFSAGDYQMRLKAVALRSDGTVSGTKLEPQGLVLRRLAKPQEGGNVYPEVIELEKAFLTGEGLDLSQIRLKQGGEFMIFEAGLGNLAASTTRGSSISINPQTLDISVTGGKHLVTGVLNGHEHAILPDLSVIYTTPGVTFDTNFRFGVYPQAALKGIDFNLPKDSATVQLPLRAQFAAKVPVLQAVKATTQFGLPYTLTSYVYDIRAREIRTTGYIGISAQGLKSCNGRPLQLGIKKLNLNLLNKGDIFSNIETSETPAEFSVFGGLATIENYDLQLTASQWQLQGDVIISWEAGSACVTSSGASGGLIIKNFTIGYKPGFGFFVSNAYKSMPANQRLKMRGVGLQVGSINFTEVNGKTRMDIHGPVMISLPFVIVQASNVSWYSTGEFSAEQFFIRIPVLYDASGYIHIMPTGGVAGGVRIQFVLGQFDFQIAVGVTNWMISFQVPIKRPWFPQGSFAQNLRLYIAQRGNSANDTGGLYFMGAWDWELFPPLGERVSIDDFTVVIDTAGLIQISGKLNIEQGKFVDGVNAVGEIRFAPVEESHIMLRVDLSVVPALAAFVDIHTAAAIVHIKFVAPTMVLVGAGAAGTFRLINGSMSIGMFFGYNADLPAGFSYNHAVKSPDLKGNKKLNGLYGILQPIDFEAGFIVGPFSVYAKQQAVWMLHASYMPVGITGGMLMNYTLRGDLDFKGVSFGMQMMSQLDTGFNATVGESPYITAAGQWRGKAYIQIAGIDAAIGVDLTGTVVFSGSGPDLKDGRADIYLGGKDSVPDAVIPKYNINFNNAVEIAKDFGEGLKTAAEGAADLVGGMCPFETDECFDCIQAAMSCYGIATTLISQRAVDKYGADGINDIIDRKLNPDSPPQEEHPIGQETSVDLPPDVAEETSEAVELEFDDENNTDPEEVILSRSELAVEDDTAASEMAPPSATEVKEQDDTSLIEEWGLCLTKKPTCKLEKGVAGYYLMALGEVANGVGARLMLQVKKCNKAKKYNQGDRDATCRNATPEQQGYKNNTEEFNDYLTQVKDMRAKAVKIGDRLERISKDSQDMPKQAASQIDDVAKLQLKVTAFLMQEDLRSKSADVLDALKKAAATDYYDILGVAQDAGSNVLNAARRQKEKDLSEPGKEAELERVITAWETLSNPVRRAAYDKKLAEDRAEEEKKFQSGVTAENKKKQAQLKAEATEILTKLEKIKAEYASLKQQRKLYKKQFKDMAGLLGEANKIYLKVKFSMNIFGRKKVTQKNRDLVAEIKKQISLLKKWNAAPVLRYGTLSGANLKAADKLLAGGEKAVQKLQRDLGLKIASPRPSLLDRATAYAGEKADDLKDYVVATLNENVYLQAEMMMFNPVGENVKFAESTISKLGVAKNTLASSASNLNPVTGVKEAVFSREAALNNIKNVNQYYINVADNGQINLQMQNPAQTTLTYRVELTRDESCPLVPDPNNRRDVNGKLLKVFAKESEATPKALVNFSWPNDKYEYICWYSRKVGRIQTVETGQREANGQETQSTWYVRQVMILKPGVGLDTTQLLSEIKEDLIIQAKKGIGAGIKYVEDKVGGVIQSLKDRYEKNEKAIMAVAQEVDAVKQAYSHYIYEGNWSPLLLELAKDPKKHTAFLRNVRNIVDRTMTSCANVTMVADDVLDLSGDIMEIFMQLHTKEKIEEIKLLVAQVKRGCAQLASINEMILTLEKQFFPAETASLTDLGGIQMRLEDIRFDEADKMIKMQGIQYLLFEGLPTETEPGSAPPPQKVAVPFSLAIAMPAKYMHDVEAPPGEMTAMQATRMLVAMASTEANPGGTVKDVAPGDQVILKQKIAKALSLREDTLTNMLSALIFAVQPEYHIYTRVSLMRIGPYDLFAENFHFSLRDKQYFPRVEKVGLSLERNPVAEYNFPGIMPAEIVLSPKSTLNQGISVAGRVTFVGNGVTLSVPDVCDMTIDSQTEIVFNMPETTLSVRNFLCDRRKPGKKIVRASFGVRFLPFALIENTIPGYTDATIVAGKILGIETVFDHIRYNNASKNLEISGNLVVPQDRYSLARIPGLLPKPVIPFSWSRRVPNTIAADERREKALSDVLGYIRTKENALRKDDEAMYSLEEGLRILSWTNGSPDQLMEHIGRLLVGSQVVELPVCSQNKADNMVRLTDIKASNEGSGLAENPAVILSIHAACPTLTTDGTFDGTNIHFAGFSLKPVTGIDMVRFPKNEIFSLKNVTFSRAGLDMSQAVAEISSVELHDGKMEIASMGSFSLNMTDSTVRLRSLRVTLDKPLQGVDVAMNNVLFYDKLAKFVDNSLKQFSLDLTISFSPRVCIQDVSFGPQFDNISPTKLKLLELLGDVNLRLSSTTGSTTQCGKLAFLQNDRYQDTEPMKKVTLKVTDYDKTPIIGAQVSVRGTAFRYAAPAVGGSADQIPRGLVALPAGQMNVFGQEGAMEEVQGKTDAAGLITFDLKPGRYNFEVLAENYDSMEQSTDQFVADAAPKGASSILTVKTGLVDATTKTTYGDQWIVGNRSWAGQRFLMNVKMLKADAALSEVKITVTDVLDGAPISGATVELKSAAGRYVLRQIGDIGGVAKSGVYYGLVPRFHAYKISIVADGYHVIGQAVTFDADEGKTEEILNVHGPQRTWQYTMVSNAKTGMRFKIRDFGFSPVTGAKLTLRKNNKVLYTFFEELDDAKKPTAYYTCVASQRNPGPCNGVENGVYQLVVEKAGYKPYSGDYQTVNVNGYPVFREIMIEALPPE